MFNAEKLEKKLGYIFKDKSLLKKAFTHSSYANAHGVESNERLEYLGDAVLQLLVSERQYAKNGGESEGEMTKRRQALVREAALLAAVEEMGIAEDLLAEGGKANIGKKTLSSLYESALAAVYLDGGYEAAKAFALRHPLFGKNENYKGELQEFLQKRKKALPEYSFQKEGRDDKPSFVCKASADGETGEGAGMSKRSAEQVAAKALLDKLKGVEKEKSEKRRK